MNNRFLVKHDDYMTPKSAWEQIKDIIPQGIIWEPFYGDGTSGEILRELEFDVIHEEEDFFENNKGDIIVSNPPYSIKKQVFKKLKELDKPFIMLVPISTITYKYFIELFENNYQLIIPRKRIHFIKKVNGEVDETAKHSPFDTIYICYKINLEQDLMYL